jgi:hypothetical protein
MIGYEVYRWRDAEGYDLIGVLPERRNNPQRVTKESILNWGEKYFGIHLNLGDTYLIEVRMNVEAIRPGSKSLYLYNLMRGRKRQGQ